MDRTISNIREFCLWHKKYNFIEPGAHLTVFVQRCGAKGATDVARVCTTSSGTVNEHMSFVDSISTCEQAPCEAPCEAPPADDIDPQMQASVVGLTATCSC
jgi:hypothetical protein